MSDLGICKIKQEYIVVTERPRELALECVSVQDKKKLEPESNGEEAPPEKKQKMSRREKKLRGQNKSRGPTFRRTNETELCNTLVGLSIGDEVVKCERKNCQFLHDVQEYLKIKPKDIGDNCYNYETFGKCGRGLACRFGGCHISPEGRNKVNLEKLTESQTKNQLQHELQIALRKRTYSFDLSEALIKYNDNRNKEKGKVKTETSSSSNNLDLPEAITTSSDNKNEDSTNTKTENITETSPVGNGDGEVVEIKLEENAVLKEEPKITTSGSVTNEDVIKLLQREKKSIDWSNKLVLSPLTTVGNLPFRRICKEFGADVTCGEMAMCSSLLQGAPQEWALVKRHHSENIFGVQLCANNPHLLTKCGQVLEQEVEIDFIDLNLGCPIELVYKQGGGCGLLRRQRVLESCVRNLSQILTIPLTVKTRTGVYSDDRVAHTLAPKFRDWGATLLTIHGRSREQRYTKVADWQYIRQVAQAASPLPVFGNGDVLTYDDYKTAMETCPELSGVMIGRGALIKPWIFTEIKEQKLWDISSSERFDLLKKYTNYGLEHWGSDNKGVENTRRFMLEWLSFLHRYVPVGLLERPPQKINERPPSYKGRDELETLMASTSAADWVKISEMLLGPVPENFQFLPKHKANSYK